MLLIKSVFDDILSFHGKDFQDHMFHSLKQSRANANC